MTADSPSQYDTAQSRRRWQFSLRAMLFFVLVVSIVFKIASRFPRQSTFTLSMTFLLLFPLVIVGVLRAPFVRFGTIAKHRCPPDGPIASMLLRSLRFLGLWQPEDAPSLVAGLTTALISTLALVGLWPLIREIGLNLSLATLQPMGYGPYTWGDATRSMMEIFPTARYWVRVWQWEAWALGRWWLLFGIIVLAWLAVSVPFKRWLKIDRASSTLARFLAFAPWFIVLEVAFLIGVWIESPATVAEPSTGFVVGIFSWDLWHWNCWLDRGWLIRGALPTFVTAGVFFVGVLRWRWPHAVVAALILVPIALILSVACTVAYQNGFPQLLLRQP